MYRSFFENTTLFASFSFQTNNSDLDHSPKPAFAERPGLGLDLRVHKKLSSALLVPVGKHPRNTLKDTKVPAVSAIRTGQDLSLLDCKQQGPDPDGWETMKSDIMIWNKAVKIAARLLQSTMSTHLISPDPIYNLKSEYRKEKDCLLNCCIGVDLCRYIQYKWKVLLILMNQFITYEIFIQQKQNYCVMSFTCMYGRSLHE